MATPRQITIRNPSPELARRLRALSEARGESQNATILYLLQLALGIQERRDRLQRYATWTREDGEAFDQALRSQRTIEPDLWS
jgi:hypothetical protein